MYMRKKRMYATRKEFFVFPLPPPVSIMLSVTGSINGVGIGRGHAVCGEILAR